MNKDLIINHIFIRLIKETKYFNLFRKYYSIEQFNQFINKQNEKCDSIDLDVIMKDIYPLNQLIQNITEGRILNFRFKYVIFEYVKPFIYEFLEENNIVQQDLFLSAFNGNKTINGYIFWKNIDEKYKIYINSILQNNKK